MTGWRIGYGVWPANVIEYADKIGVNYHSCVNTPTQFAALAATTGEQDCVDNMKKAFNFLTEYSLLLIIGALIALVWANIN